MRRKIKIWMKSASHSATIFTKWMCYLVRLKTLTLSNSRKSLWHIKTFKKYILAPSQGNPKNLAALWRSDQVNLPTGLKRKIPTKILSRNKAKAKRLLVSGKSFATLLTWLRPRSRNDESARRQSKSFTIPRHTRRNKTSSANKKITSKIWKILWKR